MYGSDDARELITADGDLGQLEGNGGGMANKACTNLDQRGLQAGQRPVGLLYGQIAPFRKTPRL